MTHAQRETAYRQRVRAARLTGRVGRSLGRKRPGLFDRLFLAVVLRLAPRGRGSDFMRDEIVDAGIEFDPRELELYSRRTINTGEEST